MAESRDLPGWPKKKLVQGVRRQLWSYGIRPTQSRLWHETWEWARKICISYVYPSWPIPSEIARNMSFCFCLKCRRTKHSSSLSVPSSNSRNR